MVQWLNKKCEAYCTRLAGSFQRFWSKNSKKISIYNKFQKIYTRLARHHLERILASDAAASTQCNLCASWTAFGLAQPKKSLICIQIFCSPFSNVNMKAASVQQEAASAVVSVDTYIHKSLVTLSIVFVTHIDIHIQLFSLYDFRLFNKFIPILINSLFWRFWVFSLNF